MTHVLNSIPSPTVSFIDLGFVRIHFYALFILLGIVLALLIGSRRLKQRGAAGGELLDISLWVVPLGLVGARFFHVVTHWNDYFGPGKDFLDVFKIWEGGIAIFGGLIGGLLGAWIGCRLTGVRLASYADAIAPGVLLAQGIGRIGNYFNSELFGQPTDLPWGLQIDSTNPAYPAGLPIGVTFHPTFAYELIWDVVGFALLILLDSRFNLRWGRLFGLYLTYYSLGRFWVESLRIDPSDIYFGFRTNQWSAIFGLAAGLLILILQSKRHTGLETSVFVEGRAPLTEPDSDSIVENEKEVDSEETSAEKIG